ncbi:nuclear transport factor 2 family protein [Amycolatopsis rhabdoformis]|uniref:Nuclear transport factor 2 family protein n=1 Tax=Amycolatopsis rhabdoformis TaxID=1448059 RepID=A0ABZ1HW61_9PSEU|nr:nuclear transport factor 2 family protein [Amycolatopsis rhabdoformis]WSE26460.1 nuclear transport factor 2 family protein [Amycolatopsis rhabdoformis]
MTPERAVQEVLARYVRATDARDGAAQGALFTEDAQVHVHVRTGPGTYKPLGDPIIGSAGVQHAVEHLMLPHPEGGTGHHVTADHLIEVNGDRAHLSAQYVVFEVRSLPHQAIRPIESGYYDTELMLIDGTWKITRHDVLGDLVPDLNS